MEELLALLIQVFVEVGLQWFGGTVLDVFAASFNDDEKDGGCGWFLIFVGMGAAAGGLSLLVAPNAVLPTAQLRALNLVVSPVMAGGLSYLVARLGYAGGASPLAHFWRGFGFALAFGLIRYGYAGR